MDKQQQENMRPRHLRLRQRGVRSQSEQQSIRSHNVLLNNNKRIRCFHPHSEPSWQMTMGEDRRGPFCLQTHLTLQRSQFQGLAFNSFLNDTFYFIIKSKFQYHHSQIFTNSISATRTYLCSEMCSLGSQRSCWFRDDLFIFNPEKRKSVIIISRRKKQDIEHWLDEESIFVSEIKLL